jgi:transposase-like protein/DNA-directed RNA polymerase subunit RPC12/RpoP
MEKAWLAARLAEGRSFESLARELGCHPSTVSYWARKHGLGSSHAARHTGRGGIDQRLLREIVACELPVRDMAEALGCSPTTVRHWLRRYGMTSAPARRRATSGAAARAGVRELDMLCGRHGLTRHVLRGDGYRCSRCGSERVSAWRRSVKRMLVAEAGGACTRCGYDRCDAALHFHHVDAATKSFALSREGVTRSLAEARAEAAKCVLLCANCHAEVESGVSDDVAGLDAERGYPA